MVLWKNSTKTRNYYPSFGIPVPAWLPIKIARLEDMLVDPAFRPSSSPHPTSPTDDPSPRFNVPDDLTIVPHAPAPVLDTESSRYSSKAPLRLASRGLGADNLVDFDSPPSRPRRRLRTLSNIDVDAAQSLIIRSNIPRALEPPSPSEYYVGTRSQASSVRYYTKEEEENTITELELGLDKSKDTEKALGRVLFNSFESGWNKLHVHHE